MGGRRCLSSGLERIDVPAPAIGRRASLRRWATSPPRRQGRCSFSTCTRSLPTAKTWRGTPAVSAGVPGWRGKLSSMPPARTAVLGSDAPEFVRARVDGRVMHPNQPPAVPVSSPACVPPAPARPLHREKIDRLSPLNYAIYLATVRARQRLRQRQRRHDPVAGTRPNGGYQTVTLP